MFINYAHRGASEYAPENTMSAFDMALQLGANGIELDLQRTRDGKIVIFHDNKIDNKSNKKGKNWGTRIAGFILCAIIGGLIGLICSIIPTIFNIWVNYIIIPILVLVLMILLLYKTSSNN